MAVGILTFLGISPLKPIIGPLIKRPTVTLAQPPDKPKAERRQGDKERGRQGELSSRVSERSTVARSLVAE
jgi:hypothetical protein